MKQTSFLPSRKIEYGGVLSIGKRRRQRPPSTKKPIHLTLRSDFAKGSHSLLRHRLLIRRIAKKTSARFNIKIYRHAICGNHLHFLISGKNRLELQNFFRVLPGQIAQQILTQFPVTDAERVKRGGTPKITKACKKNPRRFWSFLTYTRLVTWGREFTTVAKYIEQNVLEALQVIAYTPRASRFRGRSNSS
jgi:REP element-mobilizing transposase RayT